jgi:hypothetical protein
MGLFRSSRRGLNFLRFLEGSGKRSSLFSSDDDLVPKRSSSAELFPPDEDMMKGNGDACLSLIQVHVVCDEVEVCGSHGLIFRYFFLNEKAEVQTTPY